MNRNNSAFGTDYSSNGNGQNSWNGQPVSQPQGSYNNYNPAQGYVPPQMNFSRTRENAAPAAGQFTGNGYYPQNGYQTGNGYYPPQAPAQQGYAANPGNRGMYQGQSVTGSYPGQNNPYPMQNNAYTGQNNAYTGQNNAYQQPEMGSYIPQTPPNPMGATGGYQPYNPNLGQMGRTDNQGSAPQMQPGDFRNGFTAGYTARNQVPLNGGGYVPQPVPLRKQPFRFNDILLFALAGVLILLFVLGVFGKIAALKYAFAILALAAIVLFWMKPMIDSNKRLCFTVIFGVLLILTVIPFNQAGTRTGTNTANQTAVTGQTNGGSNTASTGVNSDQVIGGTVTGVTAAPQATPTTAPASNDSATLDQLQSFFYFWSVNKNDEMLSLCAPSWQASVDAPATALFGILANRKPLDYQIEKISGTADDTSRTVTLTATIDRNNGKTAVKYRLNVLMMHENGNWYVNPNSLKTYDTVETATPDTSTPTPAPQNVSPNTVLYYNPDGGSLYHADQNCKKINSRYLPLKGQFTYSEVNDEKYAKLEPCNVCAAPLR